MAYQRIVPATVLLTLLPALLPAFDAQTIFNPAPSSIVGQAVLQQQGVLTAIAPNLVEGREFNNPQAVALDTSVTPPILYVADFGNNRVLAWKNAAAFTKGDYADLAIGQRDLKSTAPQGPGADLSSGLSSPVGLAVDARGNLYVIDAGNNRVLRYPAPFAQSSALLEVDLILGQPDLTSNAPNGGQTAPAANTLALTNGGGVFRAGLAFDAQGNLWISDPGNNRVLRFPASALTPGSVNQPPADLVLGQSSFSSSALPAGVTRSGKNYLSQPAGLAFDPKGRLFIADSGNRVVVYQPPFVIGQAAARIMGVTTASSLNESTLGAIDGSGHSFPPQAVFFVGSNPYVADTGNARILGYNSFDQWPSESAAFSPPAQSVVGQLNFATGLANQGLPQPSATTLAGPQPNPFIGGPVSAAFDGAGTLYVVDSGNNRLLAFPQQQTGGFSIATRLLGQSDFQYNSLNRIDGREVGFSGNTGSCSVNGALPFLLGGSAAIDGSSTPPHLYIADPLNNRVLAYRDYRQLKAGAAADLVIGQPDLATALVNYPTNNPTQTNAQGLWSPEGLAVDAKGNLYVADTCNARVVRFPAPFAQTSNGLPQANLVLGQTNLTVQPIKDVSAQTMKSAYGLAFTSTGDLVVSDPLANRILYFQRQGGDFQSGQAAGNVFGQPDFNSSLAGELAGPHMISLDAADQLYVADTGHNRIAVLPSVPTAGVNPGVLFSIAGLSSPFGVFVDPVTGGIWVANTNGDQVLEYLSPDGSAVALIENAAPTATLNVLGPVSVTTDPFGNPVIAEGGANRIGFYYPAIDYTTSAGGVPGRLSGNAANFFGRFAPGMLATIFSFPSAPFGDTTASFTSSPIATALGDVQVLIGGILAPLLYVSPDQINFQVPDATPVGGFQEIRVSRISTGQVLASWLFRIDAASPGLFTVDGSGSGQVAALNQDGSMNSGANPAKAGSVVSLYATGQGISNTPEMPQIFINSGYVSPTFVQFSGPAPGFPGLWQINVKVPDDAPPADVVVFLVYGGVNSILDPNGIRRVTTIRTTP